MGNLLKKDGDKMTIDRICTIGPASNNKNVSTVNKEWYENCSTEFIAWHA